MKRTLETHPPSALSFQLPQLNRLDAFQPECVDPSIQRCRRHSWYAFAGKSIPNKHSRVIPAKFRIYKNYIFSKYQAWLHNRSMIRPDKWKKLEEQMARLGVYEHDLLEKFIRSSGKGGQNVNKVSSCVYLKHNPSGLEVKCQKTRSQQDNRYLARQILCDKMDQIQNKRAAEKQQAIEKIRRQKRKRSKRAKEKMLQEKHHHSDKKSSRRKPETTS